MGLADRPKVRSPLPSPESLPKLRAATSLGFTRHLPSPPPVNKTQSRQDGELLFEALTGVSAEEARCDSPLSFSSKGGSPKSSRGVGMPEAFSERSGLSRMHSPTKGHVVKTGGKKSPTTPGEGTHENDASWQEKQERISSPLSNHNGGANQEAKSDPFAEADAHVAEVISKAARRDVAFEEEPRASEVSKKISNESPVSESNSRRTRRETNDKKRPSVSPPLVRRKRSSGRARTHVGAEVGVQTEAESETEGESDDGFVFGSYESFFYQDAEVGRKRSKGKKDANQQERAEMTFSEYALLMQDSMSRLGLYADMLVDQVTGPDVSPRGPRAPPRKVTFEPEQEAALGGASKLIRHARKLAGNLHVDRQTVGLRGVRDWLMRLGDISSLDGKTSSGAVMAASAAELEASGFEGLGVSDWRLPNSPEMALQLAQEDLTERLAHLYAEKDYLLNRRAELEAAKRIATKEGDVLEDQLLKHIKKLREMEQEYEILGGRVTDCMGDVANLEGGFHQLLQEGEKLRKAAAESVSNSSRNSSVRRKKKTKKKGKKKKKKRASDESSSSESWSSGAYSDELYSDHSDSSESDSFDEVSTEEDVEENGKVVKKRVKKVVKKPKKVKKKVKKQVDDSDESESESYDEVSTEEEVEEEGAVVKKSVIKKVQKVRKKLTKLKSKVEVEESEEEVEVEEEITEDVVAEDGQVKQVKKKVKKKVKRIVRIYEEASSGSDEIDAEGNALTEEYVTETGLVKKRAKKKAGKRRVKKAVIVEEAGANDEVDENGNVLVEEFVNPEGQVRKRVRKKLKRKSAESGHVSSGSDEVDADGNVVIEDFAGVSGQVRKRAKKKVKKAVTEEVIEGNDELDADGNVMLEEYVDKEGKVRMRIKKKKVLKKPGFADVSGTSETEEGDVTEETLDENGQVKKRVKKKKSKRRMVVQDWVEGKTLDETDEIADGIEEVADESGQVKKRVKKKKSKRRTIIEEVSEDNDEVDEEGNVVLEEVIDAEGRVKKRVKKKVKREASSESDELDAEGNVVIEEVIDELGRVKKRAKKKKARRKVKKVVMEEGSDDEEETQSSDLQDEEIEEEVFEGGQVKKRVKKRVKKKKKDVEEESSGSDEIDEAGNPVTEEVTNEEGQVIKRVKKKVKKHKKKKKPVEESEESEENTVSSSEVEGTKAEGKGDHKKREEQVERRRKKKHHRKKQQNETETDSDRKAEGKQRRREKKETDVADADAGAEAGKDAKEVSRSKSKKHRSRRRRSGDEEKRAKDPQLSSIIQRLMAANKLRQKGTQTDEIMGAPPSRFGRSRGDGMKEKLEEKEVECKGLRKEVTKLRQQLRFWRQRNWAEKHGKPVAPLPLSGLDPNGVPVPEAERPQAEAGASATTYPAGTPTTGQADALSHFQAAADKVRMVSFFSRIKRAPITRVSLPRDPGSGPWKYDPDVLRASAEADEARSPTNARAGYDSDSQSPNRRVTKTVVSAAALLDPPSEPRSPTSLTTLEFKPPDAHSDELMRKQEDERNHVVWLRLRERMRALLGQMHDSRGGPAPFLGARTPGAAAFGGVSGAASPSPVLSSPEPAFREEVPGRIVSPFVSQISPAQKVNSPAAPQAKQKRLPALGTKPRRQTPQDLGPQMIINNRASRPFDDPEINQKNKGPGGRLLTKQTSTVVAPPSRGSGLPEIGERFSRLSGESRSSAGERRSRASNQ